MDSNNASSNPEKKNDNEQEVGMKNKNHMANDDENNKTANTNANDNDPHHDKKRSNTELNNNSNTSSTTTAKEDDLSRELKRQRKCNREKQRRNDVNKGYDDLLSVLVQIDPSIRADAEKRAAQRGNKSGGAKVVLLDSDISSHITRVELISRTSVVLDKLHRENEANKRIIQKLRGAAGGGVGGANSTTGTSAAASSISSLLSNARYSNHIGHHHLGGVGGNGVHTAASDVDDYVTMMVPMLTSVDSDIPSQIRKLQASQLAGNVGAVGSTANSFPLLPSHLARLGGLTSSSGAYGGGMTTTAATAAAGLSSISGLGGVSYDDPVAVMARRISSSSSSVPVFPPRQVGKTI